MKRLSIGQLHYEFSRHVEPRLRIEPGETLVIESEDALSGQIRTNDDRRDKVKMPYSNPMTGPVAISGAQPGDAIAVTIHEIKLNPPQCATRTADPKMLCEWLGNDCPHGTHVSPIRDGFIHWSENVKIPYAPMIGCLGTAPDWGSPTTGPAGPHGGNLDLVEVAPGSTIFLPVFVKDALFYMGDLHAAMGHGELSATGLEMAGETTVTIGLVKDKKLAWPRVETATEIMTISTGTPMERSIAHAMAQLALWMETDYGLNRWRAYDLLTHVARISIGYYGIGTVGVKIDKQFLVGP
jgi:acetamidase/formamidase